MVGLSPPPGFTDAKARIGCHTCRLQCALGPCRSETSLTRRRRAQFRAGGGAGMNPAGTVLAVAGRRIDPVDARRARFPAGNEALVARRIRDMMVSAASKVVVCSGACGADILALEAAAQLGLAAGWCSRLEDSNFVRRRSPIAERTGAVASTPFCNNCKANTLWN